MFTGYVSNYVCEPHLSSLQQQRILVHSIITWNLNYVMTMFTLLHSLNDFRTPYDDLQVKQTILWQYLTPIKCHGFSCVWIVLPFLEKFTSCTIKLKLYQTYGIVKRMWIFFCNDMIKQHFIKRLVKLNFIWFSTCTDFNETGFLTKDIGDSQLYERKQRSKYSWHDNIYDTD